MSATRHPAVTVLHRDDAVIAVAKPEGLLTHPSPQCPDDVSCLALAREAAGRWVYPVHRLDRATSGVLVFGLTSEAARAMAQALGERTAQKTYLAVVRGHLVGTGVVDKPLRAEPDGPEQSAVTAFAALAHTEQPWPVRPYATARYTLVELHPRTGRTHQLRKHLRSLSHPIIGDTRYGDGAHNRAFAEHTGLRRLLLHALALELPHPTTGAPLRLRAEPPPSFAAALSLFADARLPPG